MITDTCSRTEPFARPARLFPLDRERLATGANLLSRLHGRREPFDHPDWLFELKWDGFRTLAHVTGGGSKLVSRNGNAFRGFPDLAAELALEVNADDAILDGEIVKLDADGRPQFHDLMRRRGPFALVAFDVLVVNGKT